MDMGDWGGFQSRLSGLVTDGEVEAALRERFADIAPLASVSRFQGFQKQSKRYFLVNFQESADAVRLTNQYQLRSFGFNGILIEI